MNAKDKLLARLKPTVQEQAVPESCGPGKSQTIPPVQSAPPIPALSPLQKLRAKAKAIRHYADMDSTVMGAEAGREPILVRQSVLDSEPQDKLEARNSSVVATSSQVAVSAPSILESQLTAAHLLKKITANAQERAEIKPSLADILRAKVKANNSAPAIPLMDSPSKRDIVPQQEAPTLPPPDELPPAASYSLADILRAKANTPVPENTDDWDETLPLADTTHVGMVVGHPDQLPPIAPGTPPDKVIYADDKDTLRKQLDRLKTKAVEIDTSFEPVDEGPETFDLDLLDRYGNPITLNEKQAGGVDHAISRQNYVLTGEAGTGKSTAIQAVCKSLLRYHKDKLTTTDYRAMDRSGSRVMAPSICVCSYTRKAVANVQRITSMDFELSAEMEGCFQTIHNLLEYSPVITWSEIQQREVQMFKPSRGQFNPLSVTHLIIEEASMLGLDLWAELRAALNPGVQIIYVGDINQLPPVFGKSVMSYALTKLPIVHLDVVYRQALDNPIIANAHAVLHGRDIREEKPAFTWIQGKNKVAQPQETMSRAMGEFFRLGLLNKEKIDKWKQELADFNNLPPFSDLKGIPHPKSLAEIQEQEDNHVCYDPEEDIVLIPFNKNAMGTTQMNYRIAQHLGEKRGAEVFEVIASYEKHYLAVGDKVFCHKMEGTIVKIVGNMNYMGRSPMKSSVNLSRFGFYVGSAAEDAAKILNGDDDFDYSHLDIDVLATIDENEERRQASSHLVDIELETGQVITLSSAGDFNTQIFQLGYCLSIHKSQGSEWRRVFILFHKAHASMLSRELLYTAMTRAREELVIIARPELIEKAIRSPRIKGNSLAEKIEFFNSGYLDEDIEVTV